MSVLNKKASLVTNFFPILLMQHCIYSIVFDIDVMPYFTASLLPCISKAANEEIVMVVGTSVCPIMVKTGQIFVKLIVSQDKSGLLYCS